MKNSKDPFKNVKPLYVYNIEYDISKLPKTLQEIITELEKYDKESDWFNYDIKFDMLEIEAKSYLRSNHITERDYENLLNKYGWLYD